MGKALFTYYTPTMPGEQATTVWTKDEQYLRVTVFRNEYDNYDWIDEAEKLYVKLIELGWEPPAIVLGPDRGGKHSPIESSEDVSRTEMKKTLTVRGKDYEVFTWVETWRRKRESDDRWVERHEANIMAHLRKGWDPVSS